jgi:DNA replication protein DnaC
MDFNTELRQWVDGVANQRVHGTTRELVLARWDMDQFSMQLLNGRSPYPYCDDELRKVARDAYVSWQASRYSVPWQYVGKEVWVRERGIDVEVHYGGQRIAVHARAERRHQIITHRPHHQGIPLGSERSGGKILIQMRETAPSVEVRPLAAYESVAMRCPMTPIERLQTSLTSLGLKAVEARLENLLEQAAKKAPGYAEFLDELLSCEVNARRSRYLRARLQLAHLPFVKTFDQFDFGFQPSIDEKQIRELRSLRFLHEASNVILLGPPGVGKTHLSVALAEATIQSGFGAYFITAHDLVADLGRAYREGRLDRRMRVYLAPKVLIIDEMGYLPLDDLGATIFFQLVSARYERGSIILTSNKSYGDWGSIFHGDPRPPAPPFDDHQHSRRELSVEGPAEGRSVSASGGGNQASPLSLLRDVAEPSSPSRVCSAAQNRRALDPSRAVLAALPDMRERGHSGMQLPALAGELFGWGFFNRRSGEFSSGVDRFTFSLNVLYRRPIQPDQPDHSSGNGNDLFILPQPEACGDERGADWWRTIAGHRGPLVRFEVAPAA